MPPAAPETPRSGVAQETRLRLSGPVDRVARPFALEPDADTRAALAAELGLTALKKLRFAGRLEPAGGRDWHLIADLGATLVQPCGVTLAPVTTRIDETVERRYSVHWSESDLPAERELPEEVEDEPLPPVLDIEAVMTEALSLAIPPFPRAPDAEPLDAGTPDDGASDATQTRTPFAGLDEALKKLREGD